MTEDIGTAEQRARRWPVDGTSGITTRTSDLFHRPDCPAFHRGHRATIEVERVVAEAARTRGKGVCHCWDGRGVPRA